MIIGFTGKARSGKNTSADLLRGLAITNIKEIAFADLMKSFAEKAFGWDLKTMDKDVPADNGVVPREFLQHFGTEYMREKWLDTVWVDVVERQLSEADDVLYIITDVRFNNEAEMIKRRGGYIIEVVRSEQSNMSHKSENGIRPDLIDYTISNNATLLDLENNIRRVYNTILLP